MATEEVVTGGGGKGSIVFAMDCGGGRLIWGGLGRFVDVEG